MDTKFNIVKKGYNIEEVENYIEKLEKELTAYKKKEEAINSALITAQITADNTLKKAEIDANDLTEMTLNQLDKLKEIILDQKRFIGEFYEDYTNLMKRYLRPVKEEDFDPIFYKIDNIVDVIESGANETIDALKTKVFTVVEEDADLDTNASMKLKFTEPEIEPKIESKIESKIEPKIESKVKVDPKASYVLEEEDKEVVFKFQRNPMYAQDNAVRELLNK